MKRDIKWVRANCTVTTDAHGREHWSWAKSCNDKGSPQMAVESVATPVKRWVFGTLFKRNIEGLHVWSTCFNKQCVNPVCLVATDRTTARKAGKLQQWPLYDTNVAAYDDLGGAEAVGGDDVDEPLEYGRRASPQELEYRAAWRTLYSAWGIGAPA